MVTIENLSGRLVSLRLNSGTALHIPPGTTSPEIVDVEVQSNAEVQKLADRRAIALHMIAAPTGTAAESVAAEEPAAAAGTSSAKPRRK
jgi:hypothetical protein